MCAAFVIAESGLQVVAEILQIWQELAKSQFGPNPMPDLGRYKPYRIATGHQMARDFANKDKLWPIWPNIWPRVPILAEQTPC